MTDALNCTRACTPSPICTHFIYKPGWYVEVFKNYSCQLCFIDKYMEHGSGLISSPLTFRLWIFGRSNDLEMGIRDWHIIQSCSVRSDRLVFERVVCNRFLCARLSFNCWFLSPRLYFRREGQVVSEKQSGLWSRIKSLTGITGFQSARKEPTWKEVCIAPLRVIWRPQLFSILIFEVHNTLLLLLIWTVFPGSCFWFWNRNKREPSKFCQVKS